MKLSDLELLVTSLRAQSGGPSADPEVTFYLPRAAGLPAGPKDSIFFHELDIPAGTDAWECKVVCSAPGVRSKKGDFNLPVQAIDFYK